MRLIAFVAVVAVFIAGCSGQKVPVAEVLDGYTEDGYTGVDEPTPRESFLEAGELTEDDATGAETGSGGEGMPLRVKLFPTVPPETLSGTGGASRVLSLKAAEAVEELHSLGFTGQDECGLAIPDYAEPEEITYAVVTDENAAPTARDVAKAVWEYYAVVARTHEQPTPQGLLCIAQVTTQPKLEWKWADLSELVSGEASISYLLPEEVHVIGLIAGNALAVACLPPRAYGALSRDDAPIAATLLLRWAGDRWRVGVAEDFAREERESSESFCDRRVSAVKTEFADDTADTGERWQFGEWRFTEDELRDIASIAERDEEAQQ